MPRAIRKHQRRHLVYYLKVISPESGDLIGRLVDITTVGMMIIGELPREAGQKIRVRLMLPGDAGQDPGGLDLLGEVVWCHLDVNPDYYATGFRFIDLSPEAVEAIQTMVSTWGFQD